ncbi:methyltransferase [Halomonas denitrificans]|nr:methyltransferase domain-containing protein [Halomonas denitrificans]
MSRRAAWLDVLRARRDRLLADPRFQRWSLRLPIARWIARRRMRALFDLCSGFVYSQVLLACVRLDLFRRLADGPRTPSDLAAATGVPRASLDRLLEAAASLRLVETRRPDRYGLGPLGAALLGNPSVAMMIEHHDALYADLHDPVALLRGEVETTELGRFWAYSCHAGDTALDAEQTAAYSDLMAASQQMIADRVLAAYPLRAHRRLLDVGGGAGAFAVAALEANPDLQATVFDLPSVAERARRTFDEHGLADRARAFGGSFLDDPLPTGHDVISLVRVLHDHDDAAVLRLLRAARRAVTDDGRVLVAEPMRHTRSAEPVTAAYFGFYFLAMGQGRARSPRRLESLLRQAGFTAIRMHRSAAPLLVRVLTARPSRTADPGSDPG